MNCKNCKYMRKFRQLHGFRLECWCIHKKVEEMPGEIFGYRAPGFICYTDETWSPRTKTHPRWCPLHGRMRKKGSVWQSGTGIKGRLP